MGKLDQRSSRTATCEHCGVVFHPQYNAKGRFCTRPCSRMGGRMLPRDDIERLYRDGMGSGEVAAALGLRPEQVYAHLKHEGLTLSRSEALRRWHDRAGTDERAARTARAHEASRGLIRPAHVIASAAITRHERAVCIGSHEVAFAAMLTARGITFDQQTPVDRYNIDFTLAEHGVAVEIFTGGGSRGNWTKLRSRREHVLNHWNLFEVKFRKGRRVLGPEVIDELIAFCEQVGADPSTLGQYRMVWPDGQRIRARRRPSGDPVGAS